MAALSSFFKRKSSIPFTSLAIRRWFSTQPILDSPSFSQRIRDLPKDLPGTNIKKEVSQVFLFSSSLFFPFVDYFSNKCVWWARKQRKATVNSLISAIRSGNDVVLNFSVSLTGLVSDFLRFGCSWFFWVGRDFFFYFFFMNLSCLVHSNPSFWPLEFTFVSWFSLLGRLLWFF